MSFFSVNKLSVGYGRKRILQDISFDIREGELVGILGANGSGKTTLLKAVTGILPHNGYCELDGDVLEKLSPKNIAKICSYIPQRSGIEIEISALDAVLMGFNPHLGLLEHPNREMIEKAKIALTLVGLDGREEDDYLTLSEGQKQLCILARTLVSDTKLLLLDEPESALDFKLRYRTLKIIKNRLREKNRAAIVTLHDGNLALNYCDRLILLGGGKVLGDINPNRDPTEKTEKMLSLIYGSVSIRKCIGKNGKEQLFMLSEDEE